MFLQNHITKVLNCNWFFSTCYFFTRARFTFSPGFFHLLAANSTQIFDLLMNMTHEASSILKSQTQALIKHAGKLENKQKKGILRSKQCELHQPQKECQDSKLSRDFDISRRHLDISYSYRDPRHWVDAAQLEHPHQHRPPPAEARHLRIPFCR